MTSTPESVKEKIMVNPARREASDFNATIIEEFRANQGRVGGPLAGTPMILIHHIGARSGIERVTPLACNPQGDGRLAIVASMEDRPPTQTGTTTSRPTPGSQSKWVPRHSPFWRRSWTAPPAPVCGRSWSCSPLPSANTRARPRDRFRSLCSSARTELRPDADMLMAPASLANRLPGPGLESLLPGCYP